MDQTRGPTARSAADVSGLEERRLQTATRKLTSDAGAGNPTTDDDGVERRAFQLLPRQRTTGRRKRRLAHRLRVAAG